MFAIVDCNNFYASCERLFQPKLNNEPIVVLSNNDGCVIARSNEAKKLGIKMGEPFFKIKHMRTQHNLNIFSSNYALYGDLSRRVMCVLQESWPEVEIYSIDEAFLSLDKLPVIQINDFCQKLQAKVLKHTGIPVSIGVGETKTLAKLANKIAKTELKTPVFILDKNSFWLEKISAGDIWGVGRQWAKKLAALNILSAKDLQQSDSALIKNKFSVVLKRTVLELKGVSCVNIDSGEAKKSIVSSKSFGNMQTDQQQIMAALSAYCERASEKLRKQKSVAGFIQVFICSNQFRLDLPQYSNTITFKLTNPTDDTRKIIKCAHHCLNRLFKEGYHYKKVGVMLGDLNAKNQQQFDLFSDESEEMIESSKSLMNVMDSINKRYGRESLTLASNQSAKSWKAKSDYKSPNYTTCWDDLPLVK